MMVFRFLLALMALLTGIAASAQSAVTVSSVQSSVGSASPGAAIHTAHVAKQKSSVNFGAIAWVPARWGRHQATDFFTAQAPAFRPSPIIFIGDRQRV